MKLGALIGVAGAHYMKLGLVLIGVAGAHYGDPHIGGSGCEPDEMVQTEFTGEMCCPHCAFDPCPTDVPPNVTAKPACVLGSERTSVPLYCALLCSSDSQCGKALCQNVTGAGEKTVGVCVYPDQSLIAAAT
jgi:hypothetical protein